ncbi:hypothetical protein F5141DRAFT_732710 [Pisolithus sp. B1]|nr:hypothetical protein F5141DRAFT_732710 [Pisolithus sp. B1]
MSTHLWTTMYVPKTLKEISGNKGQVKKLRRWLRDWPSSLESNFKKPGKNATNVYRAVLCKDRSPRNRKIYFCASAC